MLVTVKPLEGPTGITGRTHRQKQGKISVVTKEKKTNIFEIYTYNYLVLL